MQRQRDLPLHGHAIDRRVARRVEPRLRHAVHARLLDHLGIVGIEEQPELGAVEVLLVGDRRRLLDAVRVVQQHAEVADAAHAGLGADGGLARLDARVAEDALLRLPRRPVVVDLLVRAAGDAHAPSAALVLVDQDDAVLLALVDRARRARGDARGVEAVLAQPRQVHHEGVLELAVDLLLHALEVRVLAALRELAAEDLLPVGAPDDLLHPLARDQRARARHRRRLHLRRRVQVLVVERERLVVVVDLRQVRVGEHLHQDRPLAALARLEAAVAPDPAAVPAVLVLPVLGIADAGLGLDVVEPGVLHALAVRPDVLAGDRAGVAADALVQVEDHADLRADLHRLSPSSCRVRPTRRPVPGRRASPRSSSCARRRTRRGWCRSSRSS